MFHWEVRQPDVLFQRNRRRSARDVTDLRSINVHRIVISRDISSQHDEAGELSLDAIELLFCQNVASDEVALVGLYSPSQTGFEKCCRAIEVVPIEKKLCFKPQGIACAQTGSFAR